MERDPEVARDRLPLERLLPEREDAERLEPDRDPLARVDAFVRAELERDELEPEDEPERDELDRERADELLLRPLADELLLRPLDDELLLRALDELRELLDVRRRLEERRRVPPLRSAAGTSSRATAFASWSIWRSRNFAIRSSSRRMLLATFAVSLSPTESANDSIVL